MVGHRYGTNLSEWLESKKQAAVWGPLFFYNSGLAVIILYRKSSIIYSIILQYNQATPGANSRKIKKKKRITT